MSGNHGLDPAIDLRLGDRRASVGLSDLAAAVGVPAARLRGVFLSVLLTSRHGGGAALAHPSSSATTGPEGEATEGESQRSPTFPNEEKGPETFGTSESERSDARETPHAVRDLAAHLAESLGDAANLGAYESLVARYTEALLRRALDVALLVPTERIRTTRGAYFTGVLRRLITNHTRTYDRPSPSPP